MKMSGVGGRLFLLLLTGAPSVCGQGAFVHPGLLHSQADLDRMRRAVAFREDPIYSGFEIFRKDPQSQAGYRMRGPFAEIGRNPSVHFGEFDHDANAAYQCAIMGFITGGKAYTEKSREILDAWSSRLQTVSGADAVLMASLGPFKMINAAEILRHTKAGWTEAEAAQFERMLRTAIYPVLKDFALFANGNWDTGTIKTLLAMGVFCDDRALVERALRYYADGSGNGRLTHYVYENGQCQESGRDQAHTQLGLAHLGDCCEIAWHQGLDLYGSAGNRLLLGFEYTARYNLGNPVTFVPDLDRTGKYAHRAISPRGALRPVFEEIANHYVNRMKLSAPFVRQAVEKLRPEGPAQGADHPGFGTLLFAQAPGAQEATLPPLARPAAPGGLIARSTPSDIRITWVGSVGAVGYTIERALVPGGPPTVISSQIKDTAFEDSLVERGRLYRYAVSGENAIGTGLPSVPAEACAGLPAPWEHRDIGSVAVAGTAQYDGQTYSVEGAGTDIGGASDSFQFLHASRAGDQTITARFVPQTNSQSAEMGLMMRASPAPDSAEVSLLVMSVPGESPERPDWTVRLLARAATGAETSVKGDSGSLPPPVVAYGRLLRPCWLRLVRSADTFAGWTSPDGLTWKQIGLVRLSLPSPLLSGLAACSRLTTMTTTVNFDHVTAL